MRTKASYIQGAAARGRRETFANAQTSRVIALIVIVAWVLLLKLFRDIKASKVDWKGWAIIAGFIALAFYLRHATGIGEF